MNKDISLKLDKASLAAAGTKVTGFLSRYAVILFFLLLAGVYGFVIAQINILSGAQPSQSDIDAQTAATPVPHIDPKVAQQLQSLKDNSVNVQTLFEQARHNPFQ